MFRRALIGVLALAAFLVAAPGALAASQTASGSGIKATLTYSYSHYRYSHLHLTIANGGQTVYSEPVADPNCGDYCAPLSTQHTLKIVDLDGSGTPQVLLDLFTGGAHCCQDDQVFVYNATANSYAKVTRSFGNYGATAKRINNKYVFESANNDFAYAFTDYADSGAPLQYFSFTGRGFTDITRQFPSAIAADAASWLKAFKSTAPQYADTTGLIAAWAADEEMLGKDSLVRSYLKQQAALKHLNAPSVLKVPENGSFITALFTFLKKEGYVA